MKTPFITLFACCLLTSFLSLAQEADTVAEEQPTTVITFDYSEFDFGKIESEDIVTHVFKFTNTGALPLIITEARGTCGCTVPFFPKVPIMPGEGSEIEVAFDPKGKQGVQRKSVIITANTSPAITTLKITSEILAPEEAESEEAESEENENEPAAIQRNKDKEAIEALNPNCFAIFPNPTNEVLQLELKEHIGTSAMVDIHNEMGEKILSKKIEHISRESTQFDVSSFSPGIYLISIRVDNYKPMTQCFVVTGK